MIYCEGKYCSRKNQCAYHENFEWKYPRQDLDLSTQAIGGEGIDIDGNRISYHEYFCGDKAFFYQRYKPLGWREDEDEEYRNAIEDFKRLGYTDEEAKELAKYINIYG